MHRLTVLHPVPCLGTALSNHKGAVPEMGICRWNKHKLGGTAARTAKEKCSMLIINITVFLSIEYMFLRLSGTVN